MRSLLEILREEEAAVKSIEQLDEQMRLRMERRAEIAAYTLECDGKTHNLERVDEEIGAIQIKHNACNTTLKNIRYTIRDYFNVIKGGDNNA